MLVPGAANVVDGWSKHASGSAGESGSGGGGEKGEGAAGEGDAGRGSGEGGGNDAGGDGTHAPHVAGHWAVIVGPLVGSLHRLDSSQHVNGVLLPGAANVVCALSTHVATHVPHVAGHWAAMAVPLVGSLHRPAN